MDPNLHSGPAHDSGPISETSPQHDDSTLTGAAAAARGIVAITTPEPEGSASMTRPNRNSMPAQSPSPSSSTSESRPSKSGSTARHASATDRGSGKEKGRGPSGSVRLDRASPPSPRVRSLTRGGPRERQRDLGTLICASHREPWIRKRTSSGERMERTTGGLVTALDSALRAWNGTWIATGERNSRGLAPKDPAGRTYTVEQIALSQQEFDDYYSGFSNRALWPLFHYFTGRVCFDQEEWEEYVKINQRFARSMVRELERSKDPDALTWIHDYHLMLSPRMVREAIPTARLGFFLHIPFPAFEVFRILPTRTAVLEGLLGADLVGFHTSSYQESFLDCVQRLLGARVGRNGEVIYRGRRTRTIAAPIGIDVARHRSLAAEPRVAAKARRIRQSIAGDRILLGVDRLDYSKGIPERLDALKLLFEKHPEHRGRVTLVQVAVPSRTRVKEYRDLKRRLDEAVGRINGQFGDAVWTPVHYITRSLQPQELAAYYLAADVAVVTPLRDGLNLVAKEYVATRGELGGALVLSELAGAADELPGAWIANPFGADSIREALHAALTEPPEDREQRMRTLTRQVCSNDVHDWARQFLDQLAEVGAR